MKRSNLEALLLQVNQGRLSRRDFIRRVAAFGLSAPMAVQLLATCGAAQAQPAGYGYRPTKAGGGGTLKLLYWQASTSLNPHFAIGTKDQDACRLFYEPLAAWDPAGELRPVLAAEIPSRQNSGLSADGKSVIWRLKPRIKWHDGQPLTADDLVFTWEYARNPATAATTFGSFDAVIVKKLDQYSVRVLFPSPSPFWAETFVGVTGMIIPKHLFKSYSGSASRDAPANLRPVGTGPYLFKEFRPGDLVTGMINPSYHMPNRPYFDAIEMKGGGDAVSAARAVLQTGEYDFAWNLQVEDDLLRKLETGGKGVVKFARGGSLELIQLNSTDPSMEVNGERSSIKTTHPTLSDPAVRQALSLLVDRDSIQKYIYGRSSEATANYFVNPERFRSPNPKYEFNVDKAIGILDRAGWKPGPDGIRIKNGKALRYVFQTTINSSRQKIQQVVKQACHRAGLDLTLKSTPAEVFFSSDVANPDTFSHFYADLQLYATGPDRPDPGRFALNFLSSEASQKSNKWQGRNISRWQNPEYDRLFAAQAAEIDPVRRADLLIRMNDLIVNDHAIIAVVTRAQVSAVKSKLVAETEWL